MVNRNIVLVIFAMLLLGVLVSMPTRVSGDDVTIQPSSKDAYISSFNPDTNYGDSVVLQTSIFAKTLVAWDVSQILAGSTIIDAQAQLYIHIAPDVSLTIFASRYVTSWEELTVTWNNEPDFTGEASAPTGTVSDVWVSWNITEFVDAWVNEEEVNEGVRFWGGFDGEDVWFRSREHVTSSTRPRLAITYTPPPAPVTSFLIYLTGGPVFFEAEVNESIPLPITIQNTGETTLTSVDVDIYNDTDVVVESDAELTISPGEERDFIIVVANTSNPNVEGTYAWRINGTATQTDPDTWEDFYFNLTILGEGELIRLFTVTVNLQDDLIPIDATTKLDVSIFNTGTATVKFSLRVTTAELEASPTTQGTVIPPDGSDFIQFTIFARGKGLFSLGLSVTPVNATTGDPIGNTLAFRLLLRVTDALSVTTFSADDIGIRDVILQGKINSIGGFDSVRVFFVLWETEVGISSAQVYPPNKQVVSFVSDFRVWVGSLAAGTNYSYEFRLEAGPETNLIQVNGGVVEFVTTREFKDPLTALRNGIAEFLGLDAIVMGFILGIVMVILVVVLMAEILEGRLEGGAALLGIAIPTWAIVGGLTALGWFPVWVIVTTMVISIAIIIGLPQFSKGGG